MQTYIDTTGILEKLDYPVNHNGLDAEAFQGRACGAVNYITQHVWASGDFLAMRTAEYLAASLYADQNNFTAQAENLKHRTLILLDLLNPKPQWRN